MDPEEQSQLLAPSREQLAAVKVFPLIPYLKRDAIVSSVDPRASDCPVNKYLPHL